MATMTDVHCTAIRTFRDTVVPIIASDRNPDGLWARRASAAALSRHVVYDACGQETTLGWVINAAARKRTLDWICSPQEQNAKLVVGGAAKLAGLDRGFHWNPAVFLRVTNDVKIAREEILGAVQPITADDSEDEAIAVANDSEDSLNSAVSSAGADRATRIALRIKTGAALMNNGALNPNAAFGGVSESGHGREYGLWGSDDFTSIHSVTCQFHDPYPGGPTP